VVERALPVLLELTARDEDHVRVREAFHVAAEIAAVPRRFHASDDSADRLFLGLHIDRGGGLTLHRRLAGGHECEQNNEGEGAQE
jgi:hypothetical protein